MSNEQLNVQDFEHAFEPEVRDAIRAKSEEMASVATYLKGRPYLDASGATHHPETGKFINPDKYFADQSDQYDSKATVERVGKDGKKEPLVYEEMTMPTLARKLAEAEHNNDTTTALSISEVLSDKMVEFSEKNNLNNDGSENLWNRIMGVKERTLNELDNGKQVDQPTTAAEYDKRAQSMIDKAIEIKQKGGNRTDYVNTLDELGRLIYDSAIAEGFSPEEAAEWVKDRVAAIDQNDLDQKRKTNHEETGETENLLNETQKKMIGCAYQVASDRLNGKASKKSEEKVYLEALDYLKSFYGTDDDNDPRIQASLEYNTELVSDIFRNLQDNSELKLEDFIASMEESEKQLREAEAGSSSDSSKGKSQEGQKTDEVPKVQGQEISKEKKEALEKARNELSEALAKDRRKHWGGSYLSEKTRIGRWLRKGKAGSARSKIVGSLLTLNSTYDSNGTETKLSAYEEALNNAGKEAADIITKAGLSQEQINSMVIEALSGEAAAIETNATKLEQQAGKKSHFANFWLKNRKGFAGWVLRYGAVGGAGVAIGFAGATLALPAVVTAAGAAGLASGAARVVSRNRANAVIGKKGKKEVVYGDAQNTETVESDMNYINEVVKKGNTVDATDLTTRIEDRRNDRIGENRKISRNMRKAALLGVTVGYWLNSLGAQNGGGSGTEGGPSTTSSTSTTPEATTSTTQPPISAEEIFARGVRQARKIHGIKANQYGTPLDKKVIEETARLAFLKDKGLI